MLRTLRDDLWVIRRARAPERRRRAQLVASGLDVEPCRALRGDIWAVSVVRDEADIIGSTISHLLHEGVDRVVVADNESRDGTLEIVRAFGDPVTALVDRCNGYYQEDKLTRLARAAARAGARWVVPFDADELWQAREGSLAQFFRNCAFGIVRADVYNFVPRASDDWSDPDPVRRIAQHQPAPARDSKYALRAHRLAVVTYGNWQVVRPGSHVIGTGLVVRHYPYRSEEQFVRKVTTGRAALEATDLDAEVGGHWRALGARPDADLHAMWEALVEHGTPLDGDAWGVGGPLTADPLR